MTVRSGYCSTPGHDDRDGRLYPRGWLCGDCAPGSAPPGLQQPAALAVTIIETPGPCCYCGTGSYLAGPDGRPVHLCCAAWSAVIADGHRCPACQIAGIYVRWAADPRTRDKPAPKLPRVMPLPRFLSDGITPYVPDPPAPARRLRVVRPD